jgi:hypothetical protein
MFSIYIKIYNPYLFKMDGQKIMQIYKSVYNSYKKSIDDLDKLREETTHRMNLKMYFKFKENECADHLAWFKENGRIDITSDGEVKANVKNDIEKDVSVKKFEELKECYNKPYNPEIAKHYIEDIIKKNQDMMNQFDNNLKKCSSENSEEESIRQCFDTNFNNLINETRSLYQSAEANI